MKRERLFYLDFVRAAATLIIVLTHFNAWYLYTSPAMPEKAVFSLWFGNIYIGEVGVSLFLILSGAALMYVYENHLNIKQFYKKRFLNIYPLFWLVYLAAFLFEFYRNQGINTSVPKYRIIYSLLGMDTYSLVLGGPPNFAIVGEWFLGMIIFSICCFRFCENGCSSIRSVYILQSIRCMSSVFLLIGMEKFFPRHFQCCFREFCLECAL